MVGCTIKDHLIGLFIKWSRTGPTRRPDRTGPRPFGRSSVLLFFVFGLQSGPGLDRVDRQLDRTEEFGRFFCVFDLEFSTPRLHFFFSSVSRCALALYLCPLRIASPPRSCSRFRLLSPLLSVSNLLSSLLSSPLSGGALVFAVGSISFSASPTIVLFGKLVVFWQPDKCFLPSSSRSSVYLSLTVVIFCCSRSSLSL